MTTTGRRRARAEKLLADVRRRRTLLRKSAGPSYEGRDRVLAACEAALVALVKSRREGGR